MLKCFSNKMISDFVRDNRPASSEISEDVLRAELTRLRVGFRTEPHDDHPNITYYIIFGFESDYYDDSEIRLVVYQGLFLRYQAVICDNAGVFTEIEEGDCFTEDLKASDVLNTVTYRPYLSANRLDGPTYPPANCVFLKNLFIDHIKTVDLPEYVRMVHQFGCINLLVCKSDVGQFKNLF